MKILGAVILISLFALGSFNFAKDRLAFNDCMERTKLEYISKKGTAHISAICKTYL
jgi:hypothetical protein